MSHTDIIANESRPSMPPHGDDKISQRPIRTRQKNRDLTPPEDDDEISLLDLLQVVVNNLRLLVLGPLAVGLVALGITFAIPPTFTASTKFMPPQQQESAAASMLASLGALGGIAGAATGLKNPADQYVSFMKSRTVQDALIDRFKLMDRFEAKYKDIARKTLDANVKIASGKDGLISIEVSDTSPVFAADLANAYVEELGKLLNRLAVTEAQQRRMFFEKQLNTAKDNLTKADQALKASGVNSNVLKSNPLAAVEGLAKLKATIAAQEIKLSSMRGYLTEAAPDFKQAQTELAAMHNQMARAEKEEPANTSANGDYVSKFRDYKYFETLFELFAKQYEMARLDESREGAVIQVVDAALPPELKTKPKKALIALMTMFSTGFALLLFVFVRQAIAGAAQTPETAARMRHLRNTWYKALGLGYPRTAVAPPLAKSKPDKFMPHPADSVSS